MSIEQEVSDMINNLATSKNPRPRIYLNYEKFTKLIEAVKPYHKKRYGGLLCDMQAYSEGYHNVLFKGCAVCLAP